MSTFVVAVAFIFSFVGTFVFAEEDNDSGSLSSPSAPPTAQDLDQARVRGDQSGRGLGTTLGDLHDKNRKTERSQGPTLLQSSLDSLFNTQSGESSALLLKNSLTLATDPYSTQCDPTSVDGSSACGTASALAAMADLTGVAAGRLAQEKTLAEQAVCRFSQVPMTTCPGTLLSNPFLAVTNSGPQAPPQLLPQIIEGLRLKGYNVHPGTGLITMPDGRQVRVDNPKSLATLPLQSQNTLNRLLEKIKSDIARKLAQVRRAGDNEALRMVRNSEALQIERAVPDGGEMAPDTATRSPRFLRSKVPERESRSSEEFSRLLSGTPIGIARSDIFKMIKKRYERKRQDHFFLGMEFQSKVSRNSDGG